MAPGTREGASHEVGVSTLLASGRVYRRLKIDELPQLWNVLAGSMSLVGPRPHLPSQTVLTEERRKSGVLRMKPGITGVSQVAGLDMSDPMRLAVSDASCMGGSEEQTSELQSLMRISYAVFCLNNKTTRLITN